VEVPAASQQIPKVLAALAVQRHHLTVEDRLLDRQLLLHPVAELLESLEDVAALGPEVAALPGDVE
jgi:hypothetical protein